jgi:hypothetical protein
MCTEGDIRIIITGNCCPEGGEERLRERCVQGEWEFYSITCKGFCGPILP